jgi:hypothetical protein
MDDHVAHTFETEVRTKFWLQNLKGRANLEELGVDG